MHFCQKKYSRYSEKYLSKYKICAILQKIRKLFQKSKIDLLEHYNRLFQSVLKSSPLYSTPELVQDIKNFLSAEIIHKFHYSDNESF